MRLPARDVSKSKLTNQIILVSGGANFLGAYLCRALVGQNCQVFSLDDLTGAKKGNILDLLGKENFFFLEHDISSPIPSGLPKFSHIFHLAGIEEYLVGRDLTLETLILNSYGTKNLLERAKEDEAKFLLASSLEVYSGILSAGHLKHYFGIGEQVYRHHTHHEAKRYAEALTVSYFERFGIDARIVRVVDVYGPCMPLEIGATTSHLVKEALEGDCLSIPADGLDILHPTFVADVVYGIVKAAFGPETKGGIFNLVNLEGITVLNFAYALKDTVKKLDPEKDLKIEFGSPEPVIKFPIPKEELACSQQALGWIPKTGLEEGLKLTLEALLEGKKVWRKEEEKVITFPLVEEGKKGKVKERLLELFGKLKSLIQARPPWPTLPSLTLPRPKFHLGIRSATFIAVILLLFNFLIFPILQLFVGALFGSGAIYSIREKSKDINIQVLEGEAKKANFFFNNAKRGLGQLSWLFWLSGQTKRSKDWHYLLDAGSNLAQALENIVASSIQSKTLVGEILGEDKKVEIEGEAFKIKVNLQKASQSLGLAAANLSSSSKNGFLFIKDVNQARGEIELAKKRVDSAIFGLEILPEVLGQDGQKTYLLLFQNNLELRPTGGFIGSYGTLNFSNGHLEKVEIDDVYNLDGQIKEQIEPPAPLKKSLGISFWGLRDSNWDPDFGKSAKVASTFYSKVFPIKIDGVFALDQTTISYLLSILGPIELEDYEETITDQNLVDRALYHAEIGFTPGSTAKKDFLGAVAKEIIDRLKDGKVEKNWPKIVSLLASLLAEKHILLYFEDPKVESFVVLENWAGELKALPQQEKTEIFTTDYLSIIEANVGANKSNRFVERKIILNPIIQRDGDLISSLKIEYFNKSPADTWPGGVYKNYLRIYLPKGAKFEEIENGGNKDPAQIEKGEEKDKEIWGFFVEVGVGERKKVVIKYRTPYRIQIMGNTTSYNLLIQKQPGIEKDPLTIDLSFPAYLKPTTTSPQSEKESEQNLKFQTNLAEDRTIEAIFSL
jgi:nucleoside-diphosphate-sugar epimerase